MLQTEDWDSERLAAAISQKVASTLYNLKAKLDSLPLSSVVSGPEREAGAGEEPMMALIEDQLYTLTHPWRQPLWGSKVRCTKEARCANLYAQFCQVVSIDGAKYADPGGQ